VFTAISVITALEALDLNTEETAFRKRSKKISIASSNGITNLLCMNGIISPNILNFYILMIISCFQEKLIFRPKKPCVNDTLNSRRQNGFSLLQMAGVELDDLSIRLVMKRVELD
jgi:hypothetical protein